MFTAGFAGMDDGPWKLAVEVVVDVKYPHGFEGSVELVQDVPVMLQLTGCADTFTKSTVKEIGKFNPIDPMGETPLLVPVTVMLAQFTAHGPLPPFAHPPSNARLKSATTNSSFFIMIEVFSLKLLAAGMPDRTSRIVQFMPIPAQFEGQLLLNLWLNVP